VEGAEEDGGEWVFGAEEVSFYFVFTSKQGVVLNLCLCLGKNCGGGLLSGKSMLFVTMRKNNSGR
jgi:hypothetical protein